MPFSLARGARTLCLLVALGAIVTVSWAYTLIPKTFEQLATNAEMVVVGKVVAQEARFNDKRTWILTHTTIEVTDSLAGSPPTVLEIVEYGGRVGNYVLSAPGDARYVEGEEVLVFICRDELSRLRTCGATQGKMQVERSTEGAVVAAGSMAGRKVTGTLQALRARVHAARRVAP